MTYIDTNERLADLLEKLVDGKASTIDLIDANDLIVDLRSSQSDVTLVDKSTFYRKYSSEKQEKPTIV